MISTKTFKEISGLINLKELTGITKPEQMSNGKSPENVDIESISVKNLSIALKKLNKYHKENLKIYLKALDTEFMISYISRYIKQIIVKTMTNGKTKEMTIAELIGSYKNDLERLQEVINAIDEQRNKLNEDRAKFVKEYKEVAQEYKLMIRHIKRVKPDVKEENIVDEKLFFAEDSMNNLLTNVKHKISSTEALKVLFLQYPDELFEAVNLKDQIEWLNENNLLKNKSDNIQGSTHSSLKVLLKQKFIERVEKDEKTYYKKRQP